MKKYILHNKYDRNSNNFVKKYKNDFDEIIDWYSDEGPEEWQKLGGSMNIVGFPSIARISYGFTDIISFPTEEDVRIFLSFDEQIADAEK